MKHSHASEVLLFARLPNHAKLAAMSPPAPRGALGACLLLGVLGCNQPIVCPESTIYDRVTDECACDADAGAVPNAEYTGCVLPDGGLVNLPLRGEAGRPARDSSTPDASFDAGVDAQPVFDSSVRDTGPQYADPTLLSLVPGAGTLQPSFDPATTAYTLTAAGPVYGLTATVAQPARASITIDGVPATSGVPLQVTTTRLIQTVVVRVIAE